MPVSVNNKCLKIAGLLRREIRQGRYTGKIPSENEIAKAHRISKATAAKVLHLLREEGLIETVVGSGSFVASRRRAFVIRFTSDLGQVRRAEASLRTLLAEKFPGVEFHFDLDGARGDWDLSTLTTLSPDGYGAFAPLSAPLLRRLARLSLRAPAETLHRRGAQTFAVPHLMSPTFLIVNHKALAAAGFHPPGAHESTGRTLLTWAREGLPLSPYDLSLTHLKEYFPFLLDAQGEGAPGEPAGVERAGEALAKWHRLRSVSRHGADIRRGEALAITASLMAEADYFAANPHYEPVLYPIQGAEGRRNVLHSQALAVSARCDGKAFAEDVIEAFFSREIQALFAGQGYGIPVLPTLDPVHPAAALALSELPHATGEYAFVGPPLLGVLMHLFHAHRRGQLSKESLLELCRALMIAQARLAEGKAPPGEH
ncbi:MAG: winged helix-turn-helix transcriptional regulator [Spirochaetes bacterium]|nr:winged helix-turn-helix transcriptional regulator [Spirochaetota bacterium]